MCNHGQNRVAMNNGNKCRSFQRFTKNLRVTEWGRRRGRRSSEVQHEACKRQLSLPSPPSPLRKQIHISRRNPLRCIRLRKETRAHGDKSEIRESAIEGGAAGRTRIQSQRQGIAVIRHSTSPFVSYHHNRLSLTIAYLIWIHSLLLSCGGRDKSFRSKSNLRNSPSSVLHRRQRRTLIGLEIAN